MSQVYCNVKRTFPAPKATLCELISLVKDRNRWTLYITATHFMQWISRERESVHNHQKLSPLFPDRNASFIVIKLKNFQFSPKSKPKRFMGFKFEKNQNDHRYKFSNNHQKSLCSIIIPIPISKNMVISKQIYFVKTDIPFLLRYDFLEKFKMTVDNIRNVSVCHDPYLRVHLCPQQGHIYFLNGNQSILHCIRTPKYASFIANSRFQTRSNCVIIENLLCHVKLNQAQKCSKK